MRDKWAYELQERCPGVQYVLVGMEPDASHKATTTELAQGNSLSREIGARKYIQCNVETGAGIDDAFEAVSLPLYPVQSFLSSRWNYVLMAVDNPGRHAQ